MEAPIGRQDPVDPCSGPPPQRHLRGEARTRYFQATLTRLEALRQRALCRRAWDGLFGPAADSVRRATEPDASDNPRAAELRQRYRELHARALQERGRAEALVAELGDGRHGRMLILTDPRSGHVLVAEEGSTVRYDPGSPASLLWVSGSRRLELDGARVAASTEMTGSRRGRLGEEFRLSWLGEPEGAIHLGGPVLVRTIAHPDGSTDCLRFAGLSSDGVALYERQHLDSKSTQNSADNYGSSIVVDGLLKDFVSGKFH